ncbi:MAG: KDO2-lipid IV(A) lauroyltransferase [Oceanospirillaceae bacterium]|jgi:KDO2-lipid IV(A) lauroyltransferase
MRIVKVILGLLFLVLMAFLPLKLSQWLGKLLGSCWYYFKRSRSYFVSKSNLDFCFQHLAEKERDALLKCSLQQTGMSLAEMGMSWLWPTSYTLKKVISVKGDEILQAAVDQGKGVIIIAPHIGNWEVLNLYASSVYPITVLYKPPKLKFFDWLINKMRSRLGGDMAPANPSGVRKLMKKLRNKGVIAILPDQEPAEGSGAYVHFFARPAYTMTLLSQLAAKTNCVVISGVGIREGSGFAIEFKTVDSNINSKDNNISLLALNQCIEKIALDNPAQYQWEYKRFKKRQQGQDNIY